MAQTVDLVGSVTAVRVAPDQEPGSVAGTELDAVDTVLPGETIETSSTSAVNMLFDAAAAMLHVSPSTVVTVRQRTDALLQLDIRQGEVLFSTAGADAPLPIVISTPAGFLTLLGDESAMLVVDVDAGEPAVVSLISGEAEVYAGEIPVAGLESLAEGSRVSAGDQQAAVVRIGEAGVDVAVATRAELIARARLIRAETLVVGAREQIEQVTVRLASASLLGPRQQRQVPRTVTAQIAIPQTLTPPVTAIAITPPAGGTGVVTAPASASQQLLAGGSPAGIIAALRLERTRIVGSPGTDGSGQVTANPNVRLPFQLVGLRR